MISTLTKFSSAFIALATVSSVGMAAAHHGAENGYNVAIVGVTLSTSDLSDPSLPPGLTVEAIQKALDESVADIEATGNHADLCYIMPDATAEATVNACLGNKEYDVVIIGAGVRLPVPNLQLFERVVNTVHTGAPAAVIGFNANPRDTASAAARALAKVQAAAN